LKRTAPLALGLAALAAVPHGPIRAVLQDPPTIAALQNAAFPGSVPPASPIRLGSLFSGLAHRPADGGDVFWGLTDRGPNDEVERDGRTLRLIHLPGHAPAILRLRASDGALAVEQAIFLKAPDGRPIGGLPNLPGHDEDPWDAAGAARLAFDPNGVDPEALARTADGFFVGEEYAPSVLRVDAAGRVVARHVPKGLGLAGAAYPVRETLPALYARRKPNRGFESLALTPDGRRLYAILQSPLLHPDRATGEASRLLRVLVLDAASLEPVAEHVIVAEPAESFGEAEQAKMKVGDATAATALALLIVEGVDARSRVYRADFSRATNLLGSRWDDPDARPALESLAPDALRAHGIVPAAKSLVADLPAALPGIPAKTEGLALVDPVTLALGNDNEFGVRADTAPSTLMLLKIADPRPGSERDLHTLANVDEVRPTHLSLQLALDFDARRIRGTNLLSLQYVTGAAPAHLDLDTHDLTIRGVSDAETGRALAFQLEAPVEFLGRRLRIDLGGTRPARVRVEYETGPDASALQWLLPRQTSGRLPFLLTQSQAHHARSWIPCADSPGARVTYDAVVRVPPGMNAVMSAEHLDHDPRAGVFRFRMRESIPPYLLALAAGEIAFRALGPRTGVYAEPAVLEAAASEFRDVEKMMEIAERLYGPYRWGRWDTIVLPASFPYGGMENPRLTFATPTLIAGDRSLVSVMAHELAHSWSGNLVTNATWSDAWLNEGFTSYLENRIVEELSGPGVAAMERLLAQLELRAGLPLLEQQSPGDSALVLDLTARNPDEGSSPIAYDKGANLLFLLESHFGRARFDAFLRGYFDRNAFASMTSARFLAILKRDLFQGDERAWHDLRIEEWVYRPGLPPNMVVAESRSYTATRAAAEAFVADGSLPEASRWVTAEWRLFLNALPARLTPAQMRAIDARFGLSRSGNAEILVAWLEKAVRSGYAEAYPAVESFLTRVGRLKFLRPLYAALVATPETRELARTIYARARPGYHPLAVAMVDGMLERGAR